VCANIGAKDGGNSSLNYINNTCNYSFDTCETIKKHF
jgi:hypothetical protein